MLLPMSLLSELSYRGDECKVTSFAVLPTAVRTDFIKSADKLISLAKVERDRSAIRIKGAERVVSQCKIRHADEIAVLERRKKKTKKKKAKVSLLPAYLAKVHENFGKQAMAIMANAKEKLKASDAVLSEITGELSDRIRVSKKKTTHEFAIAGVISRADSDAKSIAKATVRDVVETYRRTVFVGPALKELILRHKAMLEEEARKKEEARILDEKRIQELMGMLSEKKKEEETPISRWQAANIGSLSAFGAEGGASGGHPWPYGDLAFSFQQFTTRGLTLDSRGGNWPASGFGSPGHGRRAVIVRAFGGAGAFNNWVMPENRDWPTRPIPSGPLTTISSRDTPGFDSAVHMECEIAPYMDKNELVIDRRRFPQDIRNFFRGPAGSEDVFRIRYGPSGYSTASGGILAEENILIGDWDHPTNEVKWNSTLATHIRHASKGIKVQFNQVTNQYRVRCGNAPRGFNTWLESYGAPEGHSFGSNYKTFYGLFLETDEVGRPLMPVGVVGGLPNSVMVEIVTYNNRSGSIQAISNVCVSNRTVTTWVNDER